MDTTQWPQEIMVKSLSTNTSEKKPRPEKQQAVNCPRYWTQGGSIRNIPVGGGTRKNNKVIRSSSNRVSNATKNLPSILVTSSQNQNHNKIHHEERQDLNLDFTSASSPSFSVLELLTGITT
ncbi:unnamed protein product [Vicia faba]|uniref:Dof-type domain-containing protein n=1 Tax=Vicia faba TaxID=3906 RepID=A0AAV0ZXW4_VICFA|nr:unnamed protein product [Vicia faba]